MGTRARRRSRDRVQGGSVKIDASGGTEYEIDEGPALFFTTDPRRIYACVQDQRTPRILEPQYSGAFWRHPYAYLADGKTTDQAMMWHCAVCGRRFRADPRDPPKDNVIIELARGRSPVFPPAGFW